MSIRAVHGAAARPGPGPSGPDAAPIPAGSRLAAPLVALLGRPPGPLAARGAWGQGSPPPQPDCVMNTSDAATSTKALTNSPRSTWRQRGRSEVLALEGLPAGASSNTRRKLAADGTSTPTTQTGRRPAGSVVNANDLLTRSASEPNPTLYLSRAPEKGAMMRLEVRRRSSTPSAGSDSGTDVKEALGATTPFPCRQGSSQAHAGIADQRIEQLRVQP